MQWTFGGMPVYSVTAAREMLARLGSNPPAEFGRANSITNPLGQSPAMGWLLMRLGDLLNLPTAGGFNVGVDSLHDLVITDAVTDPSRPIYGGSITFRNLVITQEPWNLTPGFTPSDPNSLYLVEVADARWRVSNPFYFATVNNYYNVRAADWINKFYPSYKGLHTTTYLWAEMIQDIWSNMTTQLGPWPGLPGGILADGNPEGWSYAGSDAWKALCDVLWKLGCAVRWNHQTGIYTIVQIGADDPAVDALIAQAENAHLKVYDGERLQIVRGRFPATYRVQFQTYQPYGTELTTPGDSTQWYINQPYTVDVSLLPIIGGNAEPVIYSVWDDMRAEFAAGNMNGATPTNLAALTTRANNRAQNYLNEMSGLGGARLHRAYAGLVPIIPGSNLRVVSFRQLNNPGYPNDGGLITEIGRFPNRWLPAGGDGDGTFWTGDDPWPYDISETEDETGMHPPLLRPGLPIYPQLLQVIKINTTGSGNQIDARVMQPQGDGTLVVGETVYAAEPNGATLSAGTFVLGRLVGFANTRPVYNVVSGSGTLMQWVRITSTTATHGGYPARKQNVAPGTGSTSNAAAFTDSSGSQDAWATFPNGYVPTTADTTTPTHFLGYPVGAGDSGFQIIAMDWPAC